MGDAIAHRGPDGHGEWYCAATGVGLAHRRLSIIDLSAEGSQPMQSFCGRYVVVFNGEIYNYESLRQSIEAKFSFNAWRGTSDTEVLATTIAH